MLVLAPQNQKMGKVYAAILFVFISLGLSAQDLHFSQFYNSPLTINPALTGKEDALLRINANYRSQWYTLKNSNPIRTIAVSVDGKPLEDLIPEYDNLGIGLQLFNDVAGDGHYSNTSALLSVAYHKALGYNNKIAVGIQPGFGRKSIDFSKLVVQNQYIGIGFDKNLPWGEPTNNNNFNHLELGAGALYSYRSNNDQWHGFVGGSMFHINEPNTSFFQDDVALAKRTVLNGGLTYFTDNGLVISPSALYMKQAGAKETNVGVLVGKDMTAKYATTYGNKQTALYGGLFYRVGDAIIGKAGVQFNDMNIGFSGDFNNSDIRDALGLNSALEVSFTWLAFREKDGKPMFCPAF